MENITFVGKKQKWVFDKFISLYGELGTLKNSGLSKYSHSLSDGTIVLHHFFKHEGRWLGYAILIGPKGGERVVHDFDVIGKDESDLCLVPKLSLVSKPPKTWGYRRR